MKKIVIIDLTSNFTHAFINNKSTGASSHQLYNLIKSLLKKYSIVCYNKIVSTLEIDGVKYMNYNNLYYDTINVSDIILVQKFFPIDVNILNKIVKNKIYFWIHDLIENKIFLNNEKKYIDYFNEEPEKFKQFLNAIFIKKNVNFVLPSNFTKKIFFDYFTKLDIEINPLKVNIINHILYDNDFKTYKKKDIPINLYNIVYASAWEKGVWDVIKLFDYLLSKDNNYRLILMSPKEIIPTLEQYKKDLIFKYGDKICILGPMEKTEYCKIIKSSLCVLSSKFSETFGSVFAESLYLGTPVIGDVNSGTVPEIVGSNYIINYDYLDKFYDKLIEIRTNRKTLNITLNNKFSFDENIKLWFNLLD